MSNAEAKHPVDLSSLSDGELVELARRRVPEALRFIIARHNRRLYRVARSILRDSHEAEDVVQEVYVRAFTALDSFRGEASVGTWLTRIALNEALTRVRRQKPTVDLTVLDSPNQPQAMQIIPFPLMSSDPDPETAAARRQVARLLENAIDDLPEPFRTVFVMRDIEELSVEETATLLGLRPETVRTRLHRARTQLRSALKVQLASALSDAFPFAGHRCARLAKSVLGRLDCQYGFFTPEESP